MPPLLDSFHLFKANICFDDVIVVVAFSSLAKILGEGSTIHSPSALFLSSRTLIPLFRPGSVHSGSRS